MLPLQGRPPAAPVGRPVQVRLARKPHCTRTTPTWSHTGRPCSHGTTLPRTLAARTAKQRLPVLYHPVLRGAESLQKRINATCPSCMVNIFKVAFSPYMHSLPGANQCSSTQQGRTCGVGGAGLHLQQDELVLPCPQQRPGDVLRLLRPCARPVPAQPDLACLTCPSLTQRISNRRSAQAQTK